MAFWGPDFDALQNQDPDIAGILISELERLRGGLQLIASENFTSPAVLAALGSTLSNKYAENIYCDTFFYIFNNTIPRRIVCRNKFNYFCILKKTPFLYRLDIKITNFLFSREKKLNNFI